MSKESRRRQRMTGQASGSGSDAAPTSRASGPDRPAPSRGTDHRPSISPVGTPRVGRRDRPRPAVRGSFLERYRLLIIGAAVVAVLAIVGVGVFAAATQPVYACSTIWQPDPTASPAAGASAQPGYVQPDMGNQHVAVGTVIKYTYCPPASGKHYFASGRGPIADRVYGPNDGVVPDGWVHNLEHGGLVILYKGADPDITALTALFNAVPVSPVCGFPPGGNSPGPVVARFDDMAWPYAALVWDRVLPLQTLDQAAILDFYARFGERNNPEKLCAAPSASPSASASAGPSGSASPSAPATPSATPVPSASAGPTTQASPSPS